MQLSQLLLAALTVFSLTQCGQQPGRSEAPKPTTSATPVAAKMNAADLAKYHRATFAAGCFWCEEGVFESINGVSEVISGYAGGQTKNPSYEQVGTGNTGHAESFEVYYDSTVIDYPNLLRVYFASLDPTQVDGQGPDHGSQYRSIIFYRNATEKKLAEDFIAQLSSSGKYNRPIVVQVVPFTEFYKAEDYHQDYVQHHPENPYVQHESIPRMRRTLAQVPELVKKGH